MATSRITTTGGRQGEGNQGLQVKPSDLVFSTSCSLGTVRPLSNSPAPERAPQSRALPRPPPLPASPPLPAACPPGAAWPPRVPPAAARRCDRRPISSSSTSRRARRSSPSSPASRPPCVASAPRSALVGLASGAEWASGLFLLSLFLFTISCDYIFGARGGRLRGGRRREEQRGSGGGGADKAAVGVCGRARGGPLWGARRRRARGWRPRRGRGHARSERAGQAERTHRARTSATLRAS